MTYEDQIARLNDLGARPSGSEGHLALIEDVADELGALGYVVERDAHTFERWDAPINASSLYVGRTEIALASVWPYSGETGTNGVTAPLVVVNGRRKNWKAATGKIAVIEVHNIDVPSNLLLKPWEWGLPFETIANPVVGSELAGTDLTKAREAGVVGVIAVWRGLPDEASRGQYLPFTRDYQGIPAVWVPESHAAAMLAAAGQGAEATLFLNATRTPGATMDTVWAVSPGSGPHSQESVLVVTHSDGGNAVEENGHLGLLALARDAATTKHDRTIVFVYTAGHLRIPAVTKHGQATTAWLDAHPELWSPTAQGLTAVAGLAIEHLGAKHFQVDPTTGHYGPDRTTEPELLYATTPQLAQLVRSTWSGAAVGSSTPVQPGALVHLGEGEPLYEHRIPAVALVTGPLYLLAEIGGDLVDIDVLTRQINSFRKLQTHLAGPADKATFGAIKLPSKLAKLRAALRALLFIARQS